MKRYEYLSFLKTVAMILVVLAHCSFFYGYDPFWIIKAEKGSYLIDWYCNVLSYCPVAVFVFISGFLFNLKISKGHISSLQLIKSKFQSFIVPWFFFGVFWLVPLYTFFNIQGFGREKDASLRAGYYSMLTGQFADVAWFLLMLFWVTLVWIVCKGFLGREKMLISAPVALGLFLGAHYGLADINYYKLSQVDVFLLIFYLGAETYHFIDNLESLKTKLVLAIGAGLFLVQAVGGQFLGVNFYFGVVIRIIAAYSFLFLGIALNQVGFVETVSITNWYKWCLRHNMDIYLFQVPWFYLGFELLYPIVGAYPCLCIAGNFVLTFIMIGLVCQALTAVRNFMKSYGYA